MEERGKLQQRLAEEEQGGANGAGEPSDNAEAAEGVQQDPLDAFMSDVTVQLEQSKVTAYSTSLPAVKNRNFLCKNSLEFTVLLFGGLP